MPRVKSILTLTIKEENLIIYHGAKYESYATGKN